jgi:tetratricopeptide (TPR) repeat protein
MSKQKRDKVFISYSHKDAEWPQKLETTKVAVLLVSDNFLASEFITQVELPAVIEAAEKGECALCWIPISDCLFEEYGLDKFQASHDYKQPLDGLDASEVKKILAGIARDIKRLYEEDVKMPLPREKQIKILSITASPEDVDDIYYEREQDIMLEVFKSFDRQEVVLDMPDPVKDSLTEIAEHLKDGKHDILHITAHGSIDKKGTGVLCLEDKWGKSQEVTGEKLLKYLVPLPRIVILSACYSARQEPDLMPVAQALFKGGIDIVIGMNKAISHEAAIEFNTAFFRALSQNKTVKEAFALGKDAIFTGEQQRIQQRPGRDALKEYDIPQLLVRKKDEKLTRHDFSDHRIAAPGRPESHHFLGAKYLERGFIGRRQVLRDIYKRIADKEGAIVLKGPGGIGKSTLTTRAATNLRVQGYDFIVIRGETTIEQILEAISRKAAASGIKKANEVYAAQVDVNDKLSWFLDNFLLKQKLMIIFDNFEENQDEEAGDFRGERLKKFLWYFRDSLKNKETFLFFSTRYSLPGFEDPGITREIPEFSMVEFRKMLRGSKALQRLDSKSIKNLVQEIGGNPRGLELLGKIAHQEFRRNDFSWQQLKELIPDLQKRIIRKAGPGDDFTPLFLDKLLTYLDAAQRELLDILSIFRSPVPAAAVTAFQVTMSLANRRKLRDLSLLECLENEKEGLYYIHRLTAQYVYRQMEEERKTRYHLQAAQYFENIKDEEGKGYVEYYIESRWHYLQAGEWDKAANITFSLERYLTLHGFPQWSMELLQELDPEKLDDAHRLVAYGRIGTLYLYFGEYDKSFEFQQKAYELAQKNNDLMNSAVFLHQVGMIYHEKGDYEAALKQYEKAKETFEKIEDFKGVAGSLLQIGMIYQEKGAYDVALTKYEKAKETFEKIGDVKGSAASFHQIGRIYQDKGDIDAALAQYRHALEIEEKNGYIAGTATTMAQMGNLYFEQNQIEAALKHFIQGYLLFSKLGFPNATKAKEDIALCRKKLPEARYKEFLQEFNLSPGMFDAPENPENGKP